MAKLLISFVFSKLPTIVLYQFYSKKKTNYKKGTILSLLLLLLSRFSRVRLCAAHQAPPSLAFSRQEH